MGSLQDILRRLFAQRLFYYALAWALSILVALVSLYGAWHSFDNPYTGNHRNDGNAGHTTIDFGGQYLMGRMLLEGHGQELYNRSRQRLLLTGVYPAADQEPDAKRSDAESLMYWMMGNDDAEAPQVLGSFLAPLAAHDGPGAAVLLAAEHREWTSERPETVASCLAPLAAPDPLGAVLFLRAGHAETLAERLDHARARQAGGPLYPPINAFLNAPLALLSVRTAYRVQQVNNLLLAFVAGLGFSVLTRRRTWWPVATLLVILFPGFMGTLNLGQNATLTLAVLVWGWALIARARPGWGGLVWGLLAFKPVWALVFFLVLVLTRRWRDSLLMLTTGAALGLVTLPFVGVHSWVDWLHVGHEAATLYNTDHNWIFLSRDVLSMPRRWLLVFDGGSGKEPVRHASPTGPSCWWYFLCGDGDVPGWLVPTLLGWGLLATVGEMTVRLAVLRKDQARAATGPAASFLLLGAWLCCFHFMYYDVLLAALPVLLLFAEPRRYLEPLYLTNVRLGRVTAGAASARWYHPDRARTDRFGRALLVLFVALFPRALLLLGLWLVVSRVGLPWQVLLLSLLEAAPSLVAFLCVGGVVVARVARPLVPPPDYRSMVVLNRVFPTLLLLVLLTQPLFPALNLGSYFGPPWDTWVLMAMWLWAGWQWLRSPPPAAEYTQGPPVEKSTALRLALPA